MSCVATILRKMVKRSFFGRNVALATLVGAMIAGCSADDKPTKNVEDPKPLVILYSGKNVSYKVDGKNFNYDVVYGMNGKEYSMELKSKGNLVRRIVDGDGDGQIGDNSFDSYTEVLSSTKIDSAETEVLNSDGTKPKRVQQQRVWTRELLTLEDGTQINVISATENPVQQAYIDVSIDKMNEADAHYTAVRNVIDGLVKDKLNEVSLTSAVKKKKKKKPSTHGSEGREESTPTE